MWPRKGPLFFAITGLRHLWDLSFRSNNDFASRFVAPRIFRRLKYLHPAVRENKMWRPNLQSLLCELNLFLAIAEFPAVVCIHETKPLDSPSDTVRQLTPERFRAYDSGLAYEGRGLLWRASPGYAAIVDDPQAALWIRRN
jgi:hypothetical protein